MTHPLSVRTDSPFSSRFFGRGVEVAPPTDTMYLVPRCPPGSGFLILSERLNLIRREIHDNIRQIGMPFRYEEGGSDHAAPPFAPLFVSATVGERV